MTDPKTTIAFMAFSEGLKGVMRHAITTAGRTESVAEHSWSLCLLAWRVFDELTVEVDQLRVLKMLIVHDLPEIITGDIPVFDKMTMQQQALAAEAKALADIAGMLPDALGAEIVALCDEFEAAQTPEAQVAKALDKLEAFMQHNTVDIATWDDNDIAYQTDINHPRNALFDADPYLRALKTQCDLDTMRKIAAAGMLDRAHPDAVAWYRAQTEGH
jgi:putative hydrolase of HD superfamily